jgi:WD40 repeat protein
VSFFPFPSLHPNGHTLASGGLDGMVKLWDIRKFGNSKRKKTPEPIATQSIGYSVSSSYFSPSGDSLLTTSFADRLDLMEGAHLESGTVKPTHSIRHNNKTGRWLTTFMATWHPELDIFVSGSMLKPRCMEVFDSSGKRIRAVTGESLTAVASRCCFHRSTDQLVMIGGNSSGRVVAVR